jgi:hypothetical protein
VIAVVGLLGASVLWPKGDEGVLPHSHPDLPDDHPHMAGRSGAHAHAFIIDDLHRRWP